MPPRVSFFIQKNYPVEIQEVNSDLGEEILDRRTYNTPCDVSSCLLGLIRRWNVTGFAPCLGDQIRISLRMETASKQGKCPFMLLSK